MNSIETSFSCQQCGTCCRWSGHVLLTDADIAGLAVAADLSEAAFIDRYTVLAVNRHQLSLADAPDGCCVLLQEDRCRFYEARPEQCRSFPFGWRVAEGCPALEKTDAERSVLIVEQKPRFQDSSRSEIS